PHSAIRNLHAVSHLLIIHTVLSLFIRESSFRSWPLPDVKAGSTTVTVKEGSTMTPEEQLIQRYFEAFNRHDIEGVIACFHDHPLIVDSEGMRFEGREEVGRHNDTRCALLPYGR